MSTEEIVEAKKFEEPVVKKPRKPRTPKAKPPKKERVGLGGIEVVANNGVVSTPPAAIANDLNKVVAWAQTNVADGDYTLRRSYNVKLSVFTKQVTRAGLQTISQAPSSEG